MKLRELHQFGPFRFDPTQYELREGDRRTNLPPSLNRLLLLLVSRPGELITREEIAATLWEQPETVNVTPGINMAIRRLRSQIGDNNGHGVFIETVIGVGYRFVAPVTHLSLPEIAADEPAPAVSALDCPDAATEAALPEPAAGEPGIEDPAPQAIAPSIPVTSRAASWWWLAAPACVLVLVLAAGAWLSYSTTRMRQASAKPTLAGRNGRPITFDELEDQLTAQAISPSGSYAAYADRAGLTLKNLATGERSLLNTPPNLKIGHIAWFPDESSLLVDDSPLQQTNPARVWRVPIHGEPASVLLQNASREAVSPDGSRIAYLDPAGDEIWIAEANGRSARKLLAAHDGETFRCLLWSAAGKAILADRHYQRLPQLAGSDLAAGLSDAARHTGEGSTYEAYSAQSGALLYQRDGLQFDSAALLKDGTLLFPVNSAPDPASIAVVETDPSTGALLSSPRLIPSAQALEITASAVAQLSATSGGRTISALIDRSTTSVYTADLLTAADRAPRLEDEQRLTRHTATTYPTAWLPDGSGVVFDDGIGGPIAIGAQALGGSSLRTLAEPRSPMEKFAQGRVSPDGRWLLFLDMDRQTSRLLAIERVPLQGGPAQIVPTQGPVKDFRCSIAICVVREVEDKNAIVYYALDPVLGMGKELARNAWQPNLLGDWSVSPNGKTVARANHDRLHPAIELVPLGRGDPAAGGSGTVREIPVQIPVQGFGTTLAANWASDGQSFFVETYADPTYNLLLLRLDGRATLLRQSSGLIWAVPSPDGKKIAFPGVNPLDRNAWMASFLTPP